MLQPCVVSRDWAFFLQPIQGSDSYWRYQRFEAKGLHTETM